MKVYVAKVNVPKGYKSPLRNRLFDINVGDVYRLDEMASMYNQRLITLECDTPLMKDDKIIGIKLVQVGKTKQVFKYFEYLDEEDVKVFQSMLHE